MDPIIGLDFGNYNSFVCYVENLDEVNRMKGTAENLNPPKLSEGIPSVYFYSQELGEVLVGEEATRSRAVPLGNRLRYLKRHLGESITLDDREISYDQAIVEVVQHCIRRANQRLHNTMLVNTRYVSLAYPATYTSARREHLIKLVERATLEDGTPVKVFGTIAEPAAAALDYLACFAKSDAETTVLTYDLGGGTFDLGLVTLYPEGRRLPSGRTYYYDVIGTGGLSDLGGKDFDEVMYQLLLKRMRGPLNPNVREVLRNLAESTKIELSSSASASPRIFVGSGYETLSVTREEFEDASRELLMRTVEETRAMLRTHASKKPELILLVGGASQMPMVKAALEEALPEYRGKIIDYRPSEAIAYGAARYGTHEVYQDVSLGGAPAGGGSNGNAESTVIQRLPHDIGVLYYSSPQGGGRHIVTLLSAGTPIPCESRKVLSHTHRSCDRSQFSVYEARGDSPDDTAVDHDYMEIMSVEVDHGRKVPEGHPHETRMKVDGRGILTIEARDASRPNLPFRTQSKQLENLSSGS